MSFKAKNLTYEKSEPKFLRNLRNQYGDGIGERHGRPNVRPVKPKDSDADDEPTYVDEQSNEVISKEEYQAMIKDAASEKEKPNEHTQNSDIQNATEKGEATEKPSNVPSQKVAEIGGLKKKKHARVVAEDDQTEEKHVQSAKPHPPKKKQKKIKLSFDQET